MKHFKIVLALTFVVVLMMGAVTFVENSFRDDIIAEAAGRANLAKDEVLPGAKSHPTVVENPLDPESSNYDSNLDVGDTGIIAVYYYEGLGYVYQANFQGFASTIEYMVGFDESGNITGYKTLSQNDSPGYGAKIGDPATWEQLFGLTISDLETGNFDGIAGATFTTNGWKGSFQKVINFHNNVFLGIEVVDITASFSNLPQSIQKVEQVEQNGVIKEYVYTVEFYSTYTSGGSTFTITVLPNSVVKSLSFIALNETAGIGTVLDNADFLAQFVNLTVESATNTEFDAIGGSTLGGGTPTVTFNAFKDAFYEAYVYHREEIEGYVVPVETREEQILRWYEELTEVGAVLSDTTSSYDLSTLPVTKVEENEDYVIVHASVAGYQLDSEIEVMIGFDIASTKVTGIRILSHGDTPGFADALLDEAYLQTLNDLSHVLVMFGEFDGVAGATYSSEQLQLGMYKVVDFFRVNFLDLPSLIIPEKPEGIETAVSNLDEAFDGTNTYTSVYENYVYSDIIRNIYEVHDGSEVVGYVYYAFQPGQYQDIEFVWGVDVNGLTQNVYVIDENTSWDLAAEYASYAGSQTFPDNQTFTQLFEGIQIDSILSSQVNIDTWSGVSTTTGGMRNAFEAIAQYHIDNNVGGGN